jgi:uncharacterized RDD family membrane protein YckC
MQYIGFGPRFLAWLIDLVVIMVVSGIVGAVLGGVGGKGAAGLANVLGLLIGIGYFVVYQEYAGQTLGKKAMGIKVVDPSGKRPTYMTFFLREIIGKFVSGLILGIGYLWVLWDPKKQALHDKIASTYVVKA